MNAETLRRSAAHRAAPLVFFDEVLVHVFQSRDAAESDREWARLCAVAAWYAADALFAFHHVLAQPPADLVARLQEHGWVLLDHGRPPGLPPATFADHLAWLRGVDERFRAAYLRVTGAPAPC